MERGTEKKEEVEEGVEAEDRGDTEPVLRGAGGPVREGGPSEWGKDDSGRRSDTCDAESPLGLQKKTSTTCTLSTPPPAHCCQRAAS